MTNRIFYAIAMAITSPMYMAAAMAQSDLTYQDEYLKRLKANQTVQPIGQTPMGENINLYTGGVSFLHTDVVLEGTGPTIVLARENLTPIIAWAHMPTLGDWTLSIPRIETMMRTNVSSNGGTWKVGHSPATASYERCKRFDAVYDSSALQPEWWHGYEFVNESGSRQQILKRGANNAAQPTLLDANGQPMVFPAVTLQHWQFGCLPGTRNGVLGEAFLAVSPDGTKYTLDHLISAPADTVEFSLDGSNIIKLRRAFLTMYVSRIEDRFGNRIDYSYTGAQLNSISASDGRKISIAWQASPARITSITVQPAAPTPQSWTYQYANGRLNKVILPDASFWEFNLPSPSSTGAVHDVSLCTTRSFPQSTWGPETLWTVKHPSGVLGTFKLSGTEHARSYVDSYCYRDVQAQRYIEMVPPIFGTNSLIQKTLSGPGLTTQTWNYVYSPPQGSTVEDACAANGTCLATRYVDVTDPGGDRNRYTLSTRWGATEGKLLQTDHYQGLNTLLRSDVVTYAAADGGLYPAAAGSSLLDWRVNYAKSEVWMPERMRVVHMPQQTSTFTWQVDVCGMKYCFDSFANPTHVTRSSSHGD